MIERSQSVPAPAWQDRLFTLRRRAFRIGIVPATAAAILIAFAVMAIFADLIATHNPREQDLRSSTLPPAFTSGGTTDHLLGTDTLGRDVFSRLVFGSRVSLSVAGLVIVIGATVGSAVGIASGYYGGIVDSIIMRIVDIALSLPLILIAIVAAVTLGASFQNVVIVIVALLWSRFARQVRAEVLSLREQDFVTLARLAGVSAFRIMARHILPNVTATIIVLTTLQVGQVVLIEASLSFLGVGVPPPAPSWGGMVNDGRAQIFDMWWVSMFPGLAIVLVVLSLNTIGDWLRDLLDPRLKLAAE